MQNLLLVIPGHLGKDVGATAALPSDDGDGPASLQRLQEERWINLQQAIGFCLAHALSDLRSELDVKLVVPRNAGLKMFVGGMIRILDFGREPFTLKDRVDLINGLGADAIEIHNNSAPFAASGFETLCFSRTSAAGGVSESYSICEAINATVAKNMTAKIRGVKPIYDRAEGRYLEREIYILKNTVRNCVITESGFLSSQRDLLNIDVDLDGYNEQMGAAIWLGYAEAYRGRLAIK